MIKMIIAIDRDGAIGNDDGSLPWKISADLKRFKELTTGSTVLMGRKTFESLGQPEGLPNRKNIVLSNSVVAFSNVGNVTYVQTIDMVVAALGGNDLWIIGGAQVYDQALSADLVDEVYITQVHINSGAPVKLKHRLDPVNFLLEQAQEGKYWTVTEFEEHLTEEIPFSYLTLKRLYEPF